ncbi:DUF3019 domain-containing protein [Shewanella mesophila]|uniref:DUF3019 domain-containing protein n=1 Tax=Shewanella mesophila TaxID=2864208 RepID=UPI0021ACA4BC|nr:DUF3019 domain-containing protein [Shewanella mesophila]
MVLIFLCNTAQASNESVEANLSLSPEFCITDSPNKTCDIKVVLNWQTDAPHTVCIMSDNESLTTWCADSPHINSLSIMVSTDRDIQFVMMDKDTHQTLAGVKLKVTPTAEPQVRRRYRNPWSLF